MKIDGTGTPKLLNATPVAVSYRTGDVVVVSAARVISVGENTVETLLKFPDGDKITTFLNTGFGIKEGDVLLIRIKKSLNNTIYATVVDKNPRNDGSGSAGNLISSLGLSYTEENLRIIMQLLGSGIEPTDESFKLFAKYKKQFSWASDEHIAFLIKNKIPVDGESVRILYDLHTGSLADMLLQLLRDAENTKRDEALRRLISDFFKNPEAPGFNSESLSQSEIASTLSGILSYIISRYDKGELRDRAKNLARHEKNKRALINSVSFDYCQIPVYINGGYFIAEAFGRKHEQESKTSVNTLYLKIPTVNLGVVRIFLCIDEDKRVECAVDAERYIDTVKQNILMLGDLLSECGYRLYKVTYDRLPVEINILNFEKYSGLVFNRKGYDRRV